MVIVKPNIKPNNSYRTKRIEDEVIMQDFFDLMNFKSKRLNNKRVVFRVRNDRHNAMIKLQESGIIRVSKKEMYRGLIGLGLIKLANQKSLCKLKIKAMRDACKGSRVVHNTRILQDALKYLDRRNKNTEKMLKDNIKKYGDNIYGARLNEYLGEGDTLRAGSSNVVVQRNIEHLCEDIIQRSESDDMFYIKREKNLENPRIDIKLPMTLTIIAFKLKGEFRTPKTFSEVYRAAFTTGLEIICNWIVQDKIPKHEYNFCKIMHNIYDHVTDSYA